MLSYHPMRMLTLRTRTATAIADLRSIRSDDPAAAVAMSTVRSALADLEQSWMPLIDRIIASDAMLSWALVPVAGGVLGATLGAAARPLAGVGDQELLAMWEDAALAVQAGGTAGEMIAAWDELSTATAELALRAAADPGIAAELVTSDRWPAVLDLLSRTRDVADRGFLDGVGPGAWVATIGNPMRSVIAAASQDDAATARLIDDGVHYSIIAEFVLADPAAFGDDLLVGLAAAHLDTDALMVDTAQRRAFVEVLLPRPELVLALLEDDAALTRLLVDGRLEDDDLTALVTVLGLGTAVVADPDLLQRGGAVLDETVRLAAAHDLTAGARHGLALAIAPYLATINRDDLADDEGPVELTVGGTDNADDQNDTVTYDELQAFMGQLLSDDEGQMIVTEVVTEFGQQQAALAVDGWQAGVPPPPTGPLDRHAEVVDLVLDSVDTENARLATAHRDAQRAGSTALGVIGLLGGLGVPLPTPAGLAMDVVGLVIGSDSGPDYIETSELRTRVSTSAKATIIERVLVDPELMAHYGWGDHPDVERTLRTLVDRYHEETDWPIRDELVSDITSVLDGLDSPLPDLLRELHDAYDQ